MCLDPCDTLVHRDAIMSADSVGGRERRKKKKRPVGPTASGGRCGCLCNRQDSSCCVPIKYL